MLLEVRHQLIVYRYLLERKLLKYDIVTIINVLNHPPSASRLRRGGLLALGAGEYGLGFLKER